MSDKMMRDENEVPGGEAGDGEAGGLPPPRQFLWFVAVAITVIGVFFVPLPSYDYDRAGLRLSSYTIAELWRVQMAATIDVAFGGLVVTMLVILIAVFLVASAIALWYALYPWDSIVPAERSDPRGISRL
jgi:hypothetical protein